MSEVTRVGDPIATALHTLAASGGLTVVDVGGGSGTHAVPLAVRGCSVTVIDPSIDALAILRRRAAEAGVADLITGVQADTDALGGLIAPASADLVVCHHVLESVDDPTSAVQALSDALAPGGTLSVVVPGRFAAVLALSMAGRFVEAEQVASSPDGRFGPGDPLLRRFDVQTVTDVLSAAGLQVDRVRGIGVVAPMVPGAVLGAPFSGPGALADLERVLGDIPGLRAIAADLHVLASRQT